MAWTPYQLFLAGLMVFTGSINTLATKWADIAESVGSNGEKHLFSHPFVQAVGMFFGELTCLITFRILMCYHTKKKTRDEDLPTSMKGRNDFNPMVFMIPALCDMTATSIMYVGLTLTYASSFQMLRGALIVFTGLLSVAFLGRKLRGYEWLGIFLVIVGLATVGISDMISPAKVDPDKPPPDMNKIITGDILIIIAQVVAAGQMVVEEKFVQNVSPLQAVGWEGFFGFFILSSLLVPMYFIPAPGKLFDTPTGRFEDSIDAFYQIKNSWQVSVGLFGTVVSIAFFNFAGISVTKQLSATTRTVLDSVRTLVIWVFSLIVQWQSFSFIQLIGFVILIVGMFLYNNVLIRPLLIKHGILKHTLETQTLTTSDDSRTVDVATAEDRQPAYEAASHSDKDLLIS